MHYYEKTDPSPWGPHLLTEQVCFSNYGKGSSHDHLCQSIVKSVHQFLKEDFQRITIHYNRKNSPAPLGASFIDRASLF